MQNKIFSETVDSHLPKYPVLHTQRLDTKQSWPREQNFKELRSARAGSRQLQSELFSGAHIPGVQIARIWLVDLV